MLMTRMTTTLSNTATISLTDENLPIGALTGQSSNLVIRHDPCNCFDEYRICSTSSPMSLNLLICLLPFLDLSAARG